MYFNKRPDTWILYDCLQVKQDGEFKFHDKKFVREERNEDPDGWTGCCWKDHHPV